MLTAMVARCPVFGGNVAGFGDAAARAVVGVRDVVQVSGGIAVVADDYWAAPQGRRALEIEWDEAEVTTDVDNMRARVEREGW